MKITLDMYSDFVTAGYLAALDPSEARLERLERICSAPWIFEAGEAWQTLSKAGYAYARQPTPRRKERLIAANENCFAMLDVRGPADKPGAAAQSGRGETGVLPRPQRHLPSQTGRRSRRPNPRHGRGRRSGRSRQCQLDLGALDLDPERDAA